MRLSSVPPSPPCPSLSVPESLRARVSSRAPVSPFPKSLLFSVPESLRCLGVCSCPSPSVPESLRARVPPCPSPSVPESLRARVSPARVSPCPSLSVPESLRARVSPCPSLSVPELSVPSLSGPVLVPESSSRADSLRAPSLSVPESLLRAESLSCAILFSPESRLRARVPSVARVPPGRVSRSVPVSPARALLPESVRARVCPRPSLAAPGPLPRALVSPRPKSLFFSAPESLLVPDLSCRVCRAPSLSISAVPITLRAQSLRARVSVMPSLSVPDEFSVPVSCPVSQCPSSSPFRVLPVPESSAPCPSSPCPILRPTPSVPESLLYRSSVPVSEVYRVTSLFLPKSLARVSRAISPLPVSPLARVLSRPEPAPAPRLRPVFRARVSPSRVSPARSPSRVSPAPLPSPYVPSPRAVSSAESYLVARVYPCRVLSCRVVPSLSVPESLRAQSLLRLRPMPQSLRAVLCRSLVPGLLSHPSVPSLCHLSCPSPLSVPIVSLTVPSRVSLLARTSPCRVSSVVLRVYVLMSYDDLSVPESFLRRSCSLSCRSRPLPASLSCPSLSVHSSDPSLLRARVTSDSPARVISRARVSCPSLSVPEVLAVHLESLVPESLRGRVPYLPESLRARVRLACTEVSPCRSPCASLHGFPHLTFPCHETLSCFRSESSSRGPESLRAESAESLRARVSVPSRPSTSPFLRAQSLRADRVSVPESPYAPESRGQRSRPDPLRARVPFLPITPCRHPCRVPSVPAVPIIRAESSPCHQTLSVPPDLSVPSSLVPSSTLPARVSVPELPPCPSLLRARVTSVPESLPGPILSVPGRRPPESLRAALTRVISVPESPQASCTSPSGRVSLARVSLRASPLTCPLPVPGRSVPESLRYPMPVPSARVPPSVPEILPQLRRVISVPSPSVPRVHPCPRPPRAADVHPWRVSPCPGLSCRKSSRFLPCPVLRARVSYRCPISPCPSPLRARPPAQSSVPRASPPCESLSCPSFSVPVPRAILPLPESPRARSLACPESLIVPRASPCRSSVARVPP
ncbi:hypothetical protein FKM82_024920 [Ascaphus truei]